MKFGKSLVIGIGVVVVGYLAKKMYNKYIKKTEQVSEEQDEVDEEFRKKSSDKKKDEELEKDKPEEINEDHSAKEAEDLPTNEDLKEYLEEKKRNKDRPPKIISAEEAEDLPKYVDQQVLYFYNYDYTITDEEDNEIEEPERLIGDCLDRYNFYESDERIIFVMNYSLDTCYEVQKVNASWTGR